jgi:hypothetical protein
MRRFGDFVAAYGMKREVYLLGSHGTWARTMRGIDPPDEDDDSDRPRLKLGGFNGMAIGPDGLLTAAGMRGEIWLFERGTWRPVDTPTNIMLKDLVAGGDGQLYACGLEGTLLAGHADSWDVVAYDGPALDFVAGRWFNGKLYLADGHSLRVMNDNTLDLVDHGAGDIVPCAAIASAPGALLSIAGQEVWESPDGVSWNMVLG